MSVVAGVVFGRALQALVKAAASGQDGGMHGWLQRRGLVVGSSTSRSKMCAWWKGTPPDAATMSRLLDELQLPEEQRRDLIVQWFTVMAQPRPKRRAAFAGPVEISA